MSIQVRDHTDIVATTHVAYQKIRTLIDEDFIWSGLII